jgi:ATP-dependent DNA helicase RecG
MTAAPPLDLLTPDSPLAEMPEVPAKVQAMLAKAGLPRAGDLLHHYPRRYEDRRRFAGFALDETPEAVCLHAMVTDCGLRRMGYRKYVEVVVEDAAGHPLAGPIRCRWFHMPWILKSFAVGQEIIVFGRVKSKGKGLVLDHPDFEIIEPNEPRTSLHMGRIVPVYPLGDGLSQKPLREAIHAVLERLDDEAVEAVLPAGSAPTAGRITHRAAALRAIHFPASLEEAADARRWLALEEFFALQLAVLRRRQRAGEQAGVVHGAPGRLLEQWLSSLPFPLTAAQSRSIEEIRRDLAAARPMNRLLQGDVGSGKTFVSMAAALVAAESGHQTAIMAPTQILAEQHYLNFQRHLEPLGVRVALRTAARKKESPSELPGSEPQVIVGTHALLFGDRPFHSLGLVVIDEQHKFGVAQRARLASHGTAPDVLVMTATPIPRTLALTVYGDLDVSVLDELPAGRGKITTAVRQGVDLVQVTAFLRQQLDKGRQAYVVYPLVEESDLLAVKAATTEHQAWQQRLPGIEVAVLHGRLKPEAKDAVMADFRSGRTRVLVSTTVVEVGVDVPNASVMLVFNAERFGLAQLHQLRGRVGRGAHHSYCILICSDQAADGLARLQVLERTRDGFAIAEADLELRGPGELLGEKQSGLPGLRLGNLAADAPLVHLARSLAESVLRDDPALAHPAHQALRRAVEAAEIRASADN